MRKADAWMIEMHYFEFNIKSYQAATAHLTNEEDLAYRRLIELYYDTEQPIPSALPDKPTALQSLSRRLRVGIPALEIVLSEFFVETENGWVHEYCERVINDFRAYIARQAANGSKGGRSRKANAKPEEPTANPPISQKNPLISQPLTKETNKQERATRLSDEWVLPSEWGNWALDQNPGWVKDDVLRIAMKFKNHWLSKAGKDARKISWKATWENWVLNEIEYAKGRSV